MSEYQLSYTAEDINRRLGLAGDAVTYAPQTLNEKQKAQARANIGTISENDCVKYIPTNKFLIEADVLPTVEIGEATNWTVEGSTFIHTSGNVEPLRIIMGDLAIAGDEWLVTFESPNITDNLIYLSFGTEAQTQVYNGTSSFAVALRVKENSDDLLVTPVKTFNGTLSNFQIQKISSAGTEQYEFDTNSIVNTNRQVSQTGFWNVILGTEHTLTNSPNSSRTIAIGHNTLKQLRTGNRNIGIGTYAMSQLEGGEQNISIGADSMFEVKSGNRNIVIGKGAASRGTYLGGNIAIGDAAMAGGTQSNANLNIVLGQNAALTLGASASSTKENTARNIIMGYTTAANLTTGQANIYIGDQITAANGKNQNVVIGASAKASGGANRSIAIGYTAETTKANQCVIGGTNITEFVLGNKKLIFNEDGTVTWEAI